MRDLKTNKMRFLKGKNDETVNEVTCMAYSNMKKYMAVGYIKEGDKKAYVIVHSIKNYGIKTKV